MSFRSSEHRAGLPGEVSTIAFDSVLEYRWGDFDFGGLSSHQDHSEFGLIEILDSQLVDRVVASSPFASAPAGQKLGGMLDERSVRHYRIAFDDHGTYDVVCTGCDVSVERRRWV